MKLIECMGVIKLFPALLIAIALLTVMLFTPEIAAFAEDKKEERPVEPAKLAALIKQADKIVVSDSVLNDAKVLYTSTEAKDIAEFSDAVVVEPPVNLFHCMCIGTAAIRLYNGDKELALITNHHGRSVRCSLWSSDARLKDPEKWLKWFDARQMPEPRKEVNDMAERARKDESSYMRWLDAMPKSLRPHWEHAIRNEISPNFKPLHAPLSKEFPDARQRSLALFKWYGSGDGPWSGYPSYESAAEELLLDIPTADLLAAAQSHNLTEAQLEGAARFFCSWDFAEKRPEDRKKLPADLRKKLLEHSLKSTDEDNITRAKQTLDQ